MRKSHFEDIENFGKDIWSKENFNSKAEWIINTREKYSKVPAQAVISQLKKLRALIQHINGNGLHNCYPKKNITYTYYKKKIQISNLPQHNNQDAHFYPYRPPPIYSLNYLCAIEQKYCRKGIYE